MFITFLFIIFPFITSFHYFSFRYCPFHYFYLLVSYTSQLSGSKRRLVFFTRPLNHRKKTCQFSSFKQSKTKKLLTYWGIFYNWTVSVQLVSRNLKFHKSVDYHRLFVCEVLSRNNKNEIIRKQIMWHELKYDRTPFFLTKIF